MIWIVKRLYTAYFAIIFFGTFFLLLPFFLIAALVKPLNRYGAHLNRVWSYVVFPFSFFPLRIRYKTKLDKKHSYVFCSNHFSYFDVLTLARTPTDYQFMGMKELQKIPIFGFIYKKLNITVDRSKSSSKKDAFTKSLQAIENNHSLILFPEGGIKSKNPPQMMPFKTGAFRVAIEKQVPIVPISLAHNWKILPAYKWVINWMPASVVYHEPIPTKGLTMDDLEELMEKTYKVIQEEI